MVLAWLVKRAPCKRWRKRAPAIILWEMDLVRTLQSPDGVALGYRLWRADGPARGLVVLLHGMASNRTRWSEFIENTILKQSWDILCPDLRGHGTSFTRGRLDMDTWCQDLSAVLEAEGYDQALIVGHSLGAQVAVHFAARHPANVSGLVLIDPLPHEALRGSMGMARRVRPLIQGLVAVLLFLNRLGLRRRRIPIRDLRQLDEQTRTSLLQTGRKQEMIALYSSPWVDLGYFPAASFLQELLEMIRPLPLEQVKAPILALLSSGITYTDPEITRAVFSRHPLASTLSVDAYHWPLTESPEQVRAAIEQWCARIAG